MKTSNYSMIMFIVLINVYLFTEEEKYQLYAFIMLSVNYITLAIEKIKEK